MEATQSRLGQDIDLRSCPDWPVIQDYTTWQHVCINLRSCFTSVVGGIEHEVSRIQFDSTGNSFWIDDFTISQAQVSSKCIQLLVTLINDLASSKTMSFLPLLGSKL